MNGVVHSGEARTAARAGSAGIAETGAADGGGGNDDGEPVAGGDEDPSSPPVQPISIGTFGPNRLVTRPDADAPTVMTAVSGSSANPLIVLDRCIPFDRGRRGVTPNPVNRPQ